MIPDRDAGIFLQLADSYIYFFTWLITRLSQVNYSQKYHKALVTVNHKAFVTLNISVNHFCPASFLSYRQRWKNIQDSNAITLSSSCSIWMRSLRYVILWWEEIKWRVFNVYLQIGVVCDSCRQRARVTRKMKSVPFKHLLPGVK